MGDANMRSLKQGDVIQVGPVRIAGSICGTLGSSSAGSSTLLAAICRQSAPQSTAPAPTNSSSTIGPTPFPPAPTCTSPCPQLERKGYYIVDVPFTSADKPIVLLNIPDGRSRVFPGMPAP